MLLNLGLGWGSKGYIGEAGWRESRAETGALQPVRDEFQARGERVLSLGLE